MTRVSTSLNANSSDNPTSCSLASPIARHQLASELNITRLQEAIPPASKLCTCLLLLAPQHPSTGQLPPSACQLATTGQEAARAECHRAAHASLGRATAEACPLAHVYTAQLPINFVASQSTQQQLGRHHHHPLSPHNEGRSSPQVVPISVKATLETQVGRRGAFFSPLVAFPSTQH